MPSTTAAVRERHSLFKSLCTLAGVVALGILLLKVKISSSNQAQLPSDVVSEDVLSPADAREWRQEYLWRRDMKKACSNSWIDDDLCTRAKKRI